MPKQKNNVERKQVRTEFAPWQWETLNNKYKHFAMLSGVACGKSFTGAHFAIKNIIEHPELTGFIGANTWDQLTSATLRELMFWLNEYGFEFVIDTRPPEHWEGKRQFKDYRNKMSVRYKNNIVTIFIRVLSMGDTLRGIEFSWYWIDETRDTPQNTHDVLLSRMRESDYIKGLITTTTRGEDWCWQRFVNTTDPNYGCIHTPTSKAVEYGIITDEFYQMLRRTYSPNMAAQELDALHVNAINGRCYYSGDVQNKFRGVFNPDPDLPLVVGMDFNFSPAPLAWVVGQISDDRESIHWFAELSGVEISTREMARRLGNQFGDYFLQIFGDASGNRGTTSNAGMTDFNQIAEELADLGVQFSIDVDQANPLVRDRIENVCRMLCDANGVRRMTYDPDRCPLLSGDIDKVTWKNGKPSGDGDCQRTHASDGCGYALWKLFPPMGGRASIGKSIPSRSSQMGR